jgi:AraC family transcriptional regulator of adaptative response / DNA-3-methyladenine glycosylase II
VLGQQVSVSAARTLATRLTEQWGEALPEPDGALTHLSPTAEALSVVPALPMPAARHRALTTLCRAVADGDVALDRRADRADVRAALLALPGIGPWTADYVALRALGDPDVFLPTDVGTRQALTALGAPDPRHDDAHERWRPWRSYAQVHLWHTLTPEGD